MPATAAHDVDMKAVTSPNPVVPVTADAADMAPSTLSEVDSPGSQPQLVSALDDASPDTKSTARKEPPPEKPSDVRRRSLIIFSFWLLVLCLGLPIWWHTTTIPRASLPLHDMMDWADGKVRRQLYPPGTCFTKHPLLNLTVVGATG